MKPLKRGDGIRLRVDPSHSLNSGGYSICEIENFASLK